MSFQFFKKYGFVESSLFAWANVENIDNLINALNNIDLIGSGKLENINPMWQCFNTGICFHGKAPIHIWKNNPTQEIITKDKNELLERLNYLKAKFINSANDGKNNLYIFKYFIYKNDSKNILNKINELFKVLKKIVSNNFDLLVVFEKKFCPEINLIQNDNIMIRTVDFFTPEENVTSQNNDKKNWNKIFSEFRPNFKLQKKKTFKFEDLE